MRASTEPLVACLAALALVGAGLYMNAGATGAAQFLGRVFLVVGVLGVAANAALYVVQRRRG